MVLILCLCNVFVLNLSVLVDGCVGLVGVVYGVLFVLMYSLSVSSVFW